VILYGRNSTDDQAEAGTIENQQGFLRNYAGLYRLNVVGEFWDEGVSGTVPLDQRPHGRRLLEAARAHAGAAVLCYRLDRMGRSLRSLLDAHAELEAAGVTIRSATEPFDTSTPIGKFLFQLLGSLAELERSTITERTMMGRDRVARSGKWTGGPIPFGYDLDADGHLAPSQRLVPSLGSTEAELVRDVFARVAAGSSGVAEARRLNALGVPCNRRYAADVVVAAGGVWQHTRINRMVRNPVYVGRHLLRAKNGPIERPTPALVDQITWHRAGEQLAQNRNLSKRETDRDYLLRGVVVCVACGRRYVGAVGAGRSGREYRYYRCGAALASTAGPRTRCTGKAVNAEALEREVWADCVRFIRDPGDAIDRARAEWRAKLAPAADAAEMRARLEVQIAEKEVERARVLSSWRRGKISEAEADRELDDVAKEAALLRSDLVSIRSSEEMARATDAYFDEAEEMLACMREELDEVERTANRARKRRIVERLVRRVEVRTEERGGRRVAVPRAYYWFRRPSHDDGIGDLPRSTRLAPEQDQGRGQGDEGCRQLDALDQIELGVHASASVCSSDAYGTAWWKSITGTGA
jgi:site-specific DNA recombinase